MIQIKSFTFNDFQENTYIISRNNQCVIIDPGNYYDNENIEIKNFIDSKNFIVNCILLTHCHIDHILGIKYLQEIFNVDVFIPAGEEEMYKSSENIAVLYGLNSYNHFEGVKLLGSENKLSFSGINFDVLNVPGHSQDHRAFLLKDEKACLSGDVLFKNSIGRTDLPGGDYDTLIKSIKNTLFLVGDDVTIYPGHGPVTLVKDEIEQNPFLN